MYLSNYSLIKNITQTAVINIVSFRIFINLTSPMLMRELTMFITAVCVLFLINYCDRAARVGEVANDNQ